MSEITKAQALAVMFDHAEELGEIPPELQDRIVQVLPLLKIALPWDGPLYGCERRSVQGSVIAWVDNVVHLGGPRTRARTKAIEVGEMWFNPHADGRRAAREWCDEQLKAHGWRFVPDLPTLKTANIRTSSEGDVEGDGDG